MKTTFELTDELAREAKVAAAKRGTTMERLVIEGLEGVLATLPPGRSHRRGGAGQRGPELS